MFLISKMVDVAVQPLNFLLLVLALAFLLLCGRWARLGRGLVGAVCAAMLALAVLPWDTLLTAPLENRFPSPELPARIDGIIVLGGALDPALSAERGQPSLNSSAERLTEFMALGLRHPEARLVFTGGSGSMLRQEAKEAPVARAFMAALGFDVGRVTFEGQSRNTWENAVYSRDLVKPQPGEAWVLVTSAIHMPRAVGAFRAAGWPVIPYPVDYQSSISGAEARFNVGSGAGVLGQGLHEWLGLAYYRRRGWSDALFPAPVPGL